MLLECCVPMCRRSNAAFRSEKLAWSSCADNASKLVRQLGCGAWL